MSPSLLYPIPGAAARAFLASGKRHFLLTGSKGAGVVGHAGFLVLLLLAQAAFGAFGVQTGIGQDLLGFDAGLFGHIGRDRGRRKFRFGRFRGRYGLRRRGRSGHRGGGHGGHAPFGDHSLHLLHLLFQVTLLELQLQNGLLAFLVLALVTGGAFLRIAELGHGVAARFFGGFGTLGGQIQLRLQLFHTAARIGLVLFQFFDLSVELINGLLVFQLPLLGFVGQRVHVGQHIILVKAQHARAEPLLLNGRFHGRHSFPPPV